MVDLRISPCVAASLLLLPLPPLAVGSMLLRLCHYLQRTWIPRSFLVFELPSQERIVDPPPGAPLILTAHYNSFPIQWPHHMVLMLQMWQSPRAGLFLLPGAAAFPPLAPFSPRLMSLVFVSLPKTLLSPLSYFFAARPSSGSSGKFIIGLLLGLPFLVLIPFDPSRFVF
jgi:hypothetical protein